MMENADDGSESDADAGLFGARWDCDGCPPPFFDLPPPPRPPFLDNPDYCNNPENSDSPRSPYDSCDNPIIIDSTGSGSWLQTEALNVVLIVITALVSVLLILLLACIVWR